MSDQRTTSWRRGREGHTIVELLVAIAIFGTLLSLGVVKFFGAREAARQAACLSNMRSATNLHLAYTVDWRERFVYAGDTARWISLPSGMSARVGGARGLPNGLWSGLFVDEWIAGRFAAPLRCSRDPAWARGAPGLVFSVSSFWLSSATWLAPETLSVGAALPASRPRDNRVGDSLYPSSKVLLFEQCGYCVGDPRAGADIARNLTPNWITSTGFVDGSARRVRRMSGMAGLRLLPFEWTIDGIRGRDIP